MTPAELEALRAVLREELRRCGLKPPPPAEFGAYRWDADADAWIAIPRADDA